MQVESICRCCLTAGFHKDLNATYTSFNRKEIYSDMLNDCFRIILDTSASSSICDICIKDLRKAHYFKEQVLKSEEEFQRRIGGVEDNDEKPLKIKLEPLVDSDDSDDYFLADAVKNASLENIKEEIDCKVEKPDRKKTKTEKITSNNSTKWPNNKIKTLVNRLTNINSISISRTTSDLQLAKKSKKHVALKGTKLSNTEENKKISGYREAKVKVIWSTPLINEKKKHRENLHTILKYTNATPFKNKSLLGFICGYCNVTYPDPKDLRSHTEMDHKKERLEFKSNFDMAEYNVQLDVSDLICLLCEEKMDNLNIFKEHIVKIHGKTFNSDIKDHILQFKLKKGDVYDCVFCSATYETFKMLKQHMNKHYSNYTCSKCDSSFATKRSLSAHSTTHIEGSHKCDYCDKVFSSKPKKHSHEKLAHLGARKSYKCPYCNVTFTSYYQQNQHLVKVHNSEARYKCNVCSKSFLLKSLLMSHIKKSHLMEKNYQCTECGFRFFSKKALKAHMVKHTGERIFMCEVCNKSYARKYTLREHMRIHNNDRRFKCDVCMMSFVQKCSLKSHLLSNHGISMAASEIGSSL